MTTTTYPIDPPIDAKLGCRNCGDPIVATAKVFHGGMSIKGLRQYEWLHAHGSDVCRPKTVAQPFDGWQATARIEAKMAAREAAQDALDAALECQP